jgi:spore coat polysaccharide biosynthesis predicted glycosyltransferase SpsG
VIDDFNRLHGYSCAAVLNFTVGAGELNYPVGNQLYLLGPEYLLIRQRLRRQRRVVATHGNDVRRVLVAMGGVDSYDSTSYLVSLLPYHARNLSLRVIVGRDYRHQERLRCLLNGFRQASILSQLTDLADEFAWAELCFCGGGLTKYESAYMGIPAGVISQNSEQAKETIQFADKGLAFNLGVHGECAEEVMAERISIFLGDRSLRQSLTEAGLAVFPDDPTGNAAAAFGRILQ